MLEAFPLGRHARQSGDKFMARTTHRRDFLKTTAAVAAGSLTLASGALPVWAAEEPWFQISLAEWSLHKAIFGGEVDNKDFAKVAKEEFGIEAIEYVNQFFKDKAQDQAYLTELKTRAEDLGVKTLLIMIDGEGALGDADENGRTRAVENHYRWVEAAKFLGCHSIRVNAASGGTYEEQQERAADGLRRLSTFAADHGLNVIVENHGGLSSNGEWLSGTIAKVGLDNCGTLPDFGNFRVSNEEMYDRYKGVTELMPFAKAVSAKSHDFDEAGNEIHTDYLKMLGIVKEAGYRGWVGIEYEGGKISEFEGIRATKALLEKVRTELA